MADEQKPSMRDRLKGAGQKSVGMALAPFRMVLRQISRLIKLILFNPITVGAVMFFLGARMHETGQLAGMFGKDLKGSTVTLSGSCLVNGKPRVPALAEDEVKITMIENDRLLGVVRKTRELVDCKLSEIALDTLPLLANISKSPSAIPELTQPLAESKLAEPAWKKLDKSTLVITGTCVSLLDEKALPAFTKEIVEITNVQALEGSETEFILAGIRSSDKASIKCVSSSIKYAPFEEPTKVASNVINEMGANQGESMIGEMIVVTGTCFPDERTRVNKVKKYLFYKMTNTRVQVLEETFDAEGKIKKFAGTIMDDPYKGDVAVCEKARFPFIYKPFDPESTKLETKIQNETEAPTAETPVAPLAQ